MHVHVIALVSVASNLLLGLERTAKIRYLPYFFHDCWDRMPYVHATRYTVQEAHVLQCKLVRHTDFPVKILKIFEVQQ